MDRVSTREIEVRLLRCTIQVLRLVYSKSGEPAHKGRGQAAHCWPLTSTARWVAALQPELIRHSPRQKHKVPVAPPPLPWAPLRARRHRATQKCRHRWQFTVPTFDIIIFGCVLNLEGGGHVCCCGSICGSNLRECWSWKAPRPPSNNKLTPRTPVGAQGGVAESQQSDDKSVEAFVHAASLLRNLRKSEIRRVYRQSNVRGQSVR